jgi:hypothetical protein
MAGRNRLRWPDVQRCVRARPLTSTLALCAAISLTAAVLLTLTGCAGQSAPRPSVAGRLVRVGGPEPGMFPLPGSVSARNEAGHAYTVSAGRDGRFRLQLPPGIYLVTGHSPLIEGGRLVCSAARRLRVTRSERVGRILVVCSIR